MKSKKDIPDKTEKTTNKPGKDDASKAYKKWQDEDKNRMGNDVSSEIKIANAGGAMEGGDNKQWHMDQGDFDQDEKNDFENTGQKE